MYIHVAIKLYQIESMNVSNMHEITEVKFDNKQTCPLRSTRVNNRKIYGVYVCYVTTTQYLHITI